MKPYEPQHDKTKQMTCAPSKDSDHPGHLPSLIRDVAACLKKVWVLSYLYSAQRRLIRQGGCRGLILVIAGSRIHFVVLCLISNLKDFVKLQNLWKKSVIFALIWTHILKGPFTRHCPCSKLRFCVLLYVILISAIFYLKLSWTRVQEWASCGRQVQYNWAHQRLN